MKKFKIKKLIETDSDGLDALKCFLPEGSILWCKTVNDKILISVKDNIDVELVLRKLNSVYIALKPSDGHI